MGYEYRSSHWCGAGSVVLNITAAGIPITVDAVSVDIEQRKAAASP
jgi:hypothetical protein